MAKLTKAQKKQQAQGLLSQFTADNALTADEIKQLNALDKSVLGDYRTSLVGQVKAGDQNALRLLGASDLAFGKSVFADKALKGTDAGNMGTALLKASAKDRAIDFGAMSEAQARLAANLYLGAGDTGLIDPRWMAEVTGQNVYQDKDGNYQLTNVGRDAFQSGLSGASDLGQYRKDFYANNVANNWYNPDGSLNEAGQKKFNEFWQSSGISNRAQALDAFNAQTNPNYTPTNPAQPGTDGAASQQLPTNINDLNQWASTNLLGQTVAPLSQQNLSALQQQTEIAQANIAAGDRNAPLRDMLLNLTQTGGAGNRQPSAGAQTDMNQIARATATGANPYLSNATQVNGFERANAANANAAQSAPTQISGFERSTAQNANAAGMNAASVNPADIRQAQAGMAGTTMAQTAQIDPRQFANAGVSLAGVNNAGISQIDLNKLREASAGTAGVRDAEAFLIDPKGNQYLGQTTGDISFNDKNRYLGMNNPYLQAMVDYATGDITRNFNNNVQNSTDAMMARAGAFGGSAWQQAQAENSRQFAGELGRAVTGLRNADYESQKALEEADLNRRLSVQVQNQNVRQGDLARNAALQSQYDTYNATAQNDMSRFNANSSNQMALQNANLGLQASMANANAYNSALAANMAAGNAGNQFNANQANQIGLANAAAQNSASRSNADAWNAMLAQNANLAQAGGQFNAGQANQAALQNANNLTATSRGNAEAVNAALMANAGYLQGANQYNAQAQNAAALQNAQLGTQNSQANAAAYNQMLLNNANLLNQNNQFNVGQANQIGMQNAQLSTQTNRANTDAFNQYLLNNANLLNQNNQFNASQANQIGLANAGAQNAASLANAGAWNNALQNNTNLLNQNNQFNSNLQLQYDQLANQTRLNAAGMYGNLGDTRYGDIQQLSNVGDAYRNYSQSLINENLNNWNTQQGWGQMQNDKLGGAINAMGSLQNTQTSAGNPYIPQSQNNGWQSLAGLGLTAASMLGGSWGGGTGGTTGTLGSTGGTFDINQFANAWNSPGLTWGW